MSAAQRPLRRGDRVLVLRCADRPELAGLIGTVRRVEGGGVFVEVEVSGANPEWMRSADVEFVAGNGGER